MRQPRNSELRTELAVEIVLGLTAIAAILAFVAFMIVREHLPWRRTLRQIRELAEVEVDHPRVRQ